MTNLVLIEKDNTYTFFDGRKKIVTVGSSEPIDKDTLEVYRNNPVELLRELESNELQ